MAISSDEKQVTYILTVYTWIYMSRENAMLFRSNYQLIFMVYGLHYELLVTFFSQSNEYVSYDLGNIFPYL